jgi:hypothetical protein
MKVNELINNFDIFVTNEERKFLDMLKEPVYYKSLTERERFLADNLIRKSLVSRIGFDNPKVVSNEFKQRSNT